MRGILPVTGLHHLGVVVTDYRRSMASFSRIFGIPRWDVQVLTNAQFGNPRVHGRDVPQHFVSALSVGGGACFELCQPLAGDRSVYAEYLDATGGGLHHSFASIVTVDEFVALRPVLDGAGIGFAQQAELSDTADYYYCETQDRLGTLAELVVIKGPDPKGGPPQPVAFGPEITDAPERPPVACLAGYGIRQDRPAPLLAAAYREIYGIDPQLAQAADGARAESHGHGALQVDIVSHDDRDAAPPGGPDMHHIITNPLPRSALERWLRWLRAEGIDPIPGSDASAGAARSCMLDARGRLDGMFVKLVLTD